MALSPADAVPDPKSGTVSNSNRNAEWSGNGPFVSNPSGTVGDPDCTTNTPLAVTCDNYKLTVNTPTGYSDGHQLKISVGFQDVSGQQASGSDFDVYLLDSNGNSVSSAATSNNPEIMVVPPKADTYTVRVVPFAVTGTETYAAKATILDKVQNPPESSDAPPKMQSFGAPEDLPRSHDAGEPSIGNSWVTGSTFYQSYLKTYKVLFNSPRERRPATANWANVTANAAKGCAQGDTTSLDPILYTDRETGRTLESQLTGLNSFTCVTPDEGETYEPSTGGGIPSGVDHQTIGGGPFKGDVNPTAPVNTYPNAIYYCSQDIATAFCARSDDGGITFGNGNPTYNLNQCGGLHGHIKVGPDGTAYLPNKGCGENQAVVVSNDNGMTWDVRRVPPSTSGDSDPSVGIGRDGAVYFGYVGADAVPRIAVSHDKGRTWENDQAVGTSFGTSGIQSAVFPAVVSGDDDRAAFAYLGTTTPGDYQSIPNFAGIWHLYVSYTYDGGKSWSTRKVQPHDPVQRGSICTGGTTCGDDRNLLDFMDATIDKRGRVLVGYADGCTGECVTTDIGPNTKPAGAPYHDAYARIARQYSGKTLFAKFDPKLPNLTIRAVERHQGTRDPNRSKLVARVFNDGTKIARHAFVTWYDNGQRLATTGGRAVRFNHGHPVRLRYNTAGLSGDHTIRAVVDQADNIKELNENDNSRSETFQIQ